MSLRQLSDQSRIKLLTGSQGLSPKDSRETSATAFGTRCDDTTAPVRPEIQRYDLQLSFTTRSPSSFTWIKYD
jgi:hypothetical protein